MIRQQINTTLSRLLLGLQMPGDGIRSISPSFHSSALTHFICVGLSHTHTHTQHGAAGGEALARSECAHFFSSQASSAQPQQCLHDLWRKQPLGERWEPYVWTLNHSLQ